MIYNGKGSTWKKGATMSQSAERCAAFVPGGTEFTQNPARYELLLRACPFTNGWKREEVKFLMSKNYSWKIYYLQILIINIYQL